MVTAKRLVLGAVCVLLLVSAVQAQRTFNVAIGLVSATGEDPDPGFFQILQDSPLKPQDWTFQNPHNNVGGNYWKTDLDTLSLEELQDYTLILVTNHQPTYFTEAEKNNLQQWVNAGGIIWIDDCGNMNPQNFFTSFSFVSYDPYAGEGSKVTDIPAHDFFNDPFVLSPVQLANLGHPGYSSHVINYDTSIFTKVLCNQDPSLTDVLVAPYGAGWLIVTADDYGCAVNDFGQSEDILFSYNILNWSAIRSHNVTHPVADAGPDQIVYAPISGQVEVTLDGSLSHDPEQDPLTYAWTWMVDANACQANGVNPTITLPVGVHTIQLIVNDGQTDSLPDDVNITVVAPVKGTLKITPRTINRKSKQPNIHGFITLPLSAVDTNEPLILCPGNIAAKRQWIAPVSVDDASQVDAIFGFFNKAALMSAVSADGRTELTVTGKLKSGPYFYGVDTIRIIH